MSANAAVEGDLVLTDYGDRATWLAARGSGIGASESAALFGVSPWDTMVSLWARKTGKVEAPEMDGEWLEWGLLLEEPMAKRYQQKTGRTVWRGESPYCIARHQKVDIMTSTPDFYVTHAPDRDGRGLLQCKNTNAFKRHDWDEGVPAFIEVQVQHEMAVTGRDWVSVAVLIGGCEFRSFDVVRNQNFIDELEEQCRIFWGYVTRDEQPPLDPSERTLETVKLLHPRDNGQTVELPEEAAVWLAQLADAKAALKEGKALKEAAEGALRNAIGDATYGRLTDGRLLSLTTTENPGYTNVVEPYSYRVLRETKATKSKGRGRR